MKFLLWLLKFAISHKGNQGRANNFKHGIWPISVKFMEDKFKMGQTYFERPEGDNITEQKCHGSQELQPDQPDSKNCFGSLM